jgi:hypothetical protein
MIPTLIVLILFVILVATESDHRDGPPPSDDHP